MSNDNVFQLTPSGKGENTKLPLNEYRVLTMTGGDFYCEGFMIFTSQHIAVMRDFGDGTIPVLVVPLANLSAAGLAEDFDDSEEEEVEDLPF